ncbi:MAG: M20/M25/M40 family metallo-hydrolase, partial [Desulfomonilaceae bacterium]
MNETAYSILLQSLDGQADRLLQLLKTWADVNTGSYNVSGLNQFLPAIQDAFATLHAVMETVALPPQIILRPHGKVSFPLGRVLSVKKSSNAPIRILLTIHYDTVYSVDHAFQKCEEIDKNTLKGPGVADAKGGLLAMVEALKLFEASPWANRLTWEVLVNPDEEIGSVGSKPLILEAAKRNDLALVFEPALADGSIVGARKGSSVYSCVIRGRSAHAGRNAAAGRNAIHAMANFIVQMQDSFSQRPGIILNVGEILGGGAVNVVPDLAYCRFNIRPQNPDDQVFINTVLERLTHGLKQVDGYNIEIIEDSSRPPKVLDRNTLT